MPGLNGTGPSGNGPLTGWGRGRCAPAAGQSGGRQGRFSDYCGFGRGRRRQAAFGGPAESTLATDTTDELRSLRQQAGSLEDSLKQIRERLDILQQENNG